MKTLMLLVLTATVSVLWLPLPLRERAGGEGRALNQLRACEVVLCDANAGPSPQPAPWEGERASPTTFATIDLTIDPQGQPLGAYQIELTSDDTTFTVVGVEAGEHDAFDHGRPPYVDPVAKQGETDRLILAEYAKPSLAADQLPTQAVRVATVHVVFTAQLGEHEQPAITLTLTAAGDADAKPIRATASHTFRTPERPE